MYLTIQYINKTIDYDHWIPFFSLIGEQLLVLPLLLHDGAGLGLSLGVVGEVVGAARDRGGDQHLLEVVEQVAVILRQERDRLPRLTSTTSTTNSVK